MDNASLDNNRKIWLTRDSEIYPNLVETFLASTMKHYQAISPTIWKSLE